MALEVREDLKDLLERPIVVSLVTMMPDNQPQATPVWFSYNGTHLLVNTAKGRQKDRNMRERPKVTVLIIDPENPYRWLEVRGKVVEITEEGALDHINSLAKAYVNREDYYAGNEEMRGKETRVICKIEPTRFTPR